MRRREGVWLLFLVALGLSGCALDPTPTAVLHVPTITGPVPLDVAYDLSYSHDPGGDTISYRLDFGDGSDAAEGTTIHVVLHHTFQVPGSYRSVLTITNSSGASSSAGIVITVSDEGPPVGIEVGETAPDFTAHRTDGGTVTLSQLRGKVVLLEFWGVWCPPCRASMPHLQELAREFAAKGLIVAAVSTDTAEQTVVDFLDANGYRDFVSIWEPGGKAGSPLTQLYGVASRAVGIPRTFLLDRQGVIRYVGQPNDLQSSDVEALL